MMPMTMPEQLDEKDDVRDLAAMLFEHIEAQINRADTKASLILAADTLFATSIAVLNRGAMISLFDDSVLVTLRAITLLTVLMFIALLGSAFFALIVTRPILKVYGAGFTLFYFGQIAHMSHHDFACRFMSLSREQFKESLLVEVHAKARIAERKFVRVRWSFDFLIGALILWSVIQVLTAFTR